MNATIEQIRQEAFQDELNKLAAEKEDIKSLMERLGRGKKQGAGKGEGMPGGMRRNKNTGGCAAGGPGGGTGGGQGKGMNRKA